MACILHIETSSKVCSLSVSENGAMVFIRESNEQMSHSVSLGLFAEEALTFLKKGGKMPDAVTISKGPGSYTGLRIGVSFAKGLCYGLGIPLISIPTLQILAKRAVCELQEQGVTLNTIDCLVPMLDARRMEVYTAVYSPSLTEICSAKAMVIDECSFLELLTDRRVLFFGEGSDKCRKVICSPNAEFIENINPSASVMVSLAEGQFANNDFVDVAYFEPFYLKEFQATIPRKQRDLFSEE
ncbi:MAG: tRNA (adenosine(37)-N6)-threonylcarbamoyltransferase complex dimerization subunit type 1 TsaB [Dysgonamonadaceae bacterium]|jgi:tRNA threonylcarbamoyladenosine biosynthesis protein TsaB|nr:tRNA (adenosine(37)-N6)-threonylcarbamoyltransferase complex dimerization subunit type 1 TsaB [Dysgonamonadaceae bacterium]